LGGLLSGQQENPRLKALRTFAAQRPQDPFPRYALAMELKSASDLQGAWLALASLIADQPDYIPSYFPGGEVLVALGRMEEARVIYGKGIEACARGGDAHMGANLEDALAGLAE
jgi:hypothetical protein